MGVITLSDFTREGHRLQRWLPIIRLLIEITFKKKDKKEKTKKKVGRGAQVVKINEEEVRGEGGRDEDGSSTNTMWPTMKREEGLDDGG